MTAWPCCDTPLQKGEVHVCRHFQGVNSKFAPTLACADGCLPTAPVHHLSLLLADEAVQVASPPFTTAIKATTEQSLFGPLPSLPTVPEPSAVPASASESDTGKAKTAAPAPSASGWAADFLKVC